MRLALVKKLEKSVRMAPGSDALVNDPYDSLRLPACCNAADTLPHDITRRFQVWNQHLCKAISELFTRSG
jgi:hypothetical protein